MGLLALASSFRVFTSSPGRDQGDRVGPGGQGVAAGLLDCGECPGPRPGSRPRSAAPGSPPRASSIGPSSATRKMTGDPMRRSAATRPRPPAWPGLPGGIPAPIARKPPSTRISSTPRPVGEQPQGDPGHDRRVDVPAEGGLANCASASRLNPGCPLAAIVRIGPALMALTLTCLAPRSRAR